VPLGVHGDPFTEEVIKHDIIDNDSSHDGWIQTERRKHNTQNIGLRLP
jgi:hypothetical protein